MLKRNRKIRAVLEVGARAHLHKLAKSAPLMLWRAIGAFISIAAIHAVARAIAEPTANLPFITSVVLIFGAPDSPSARPRAVVGAHSMCGIIGLLVVTLLGSGWATSSLSVVLALVAMRTARVFHPPAGLSAALMAAGCPDPFSLFMPICIGAAALALFTISWSAIGSLLVSRCCPLKEVNTANEKDDTE